MKLPPASAWAVPVWVPFHELVLSRACNLKTAWILSRAVFSEETAFEGDQRKELGFSAKEAATINATQQASNSTRYGILV